MLQKTLGTCGSAIQSTYIIQSRGAAASRIIASLVSSCNPFLGDTVNLASSTN